MAEEKDPAVIDMDTIEELRLTQRMIRTWVPEVFPKNEKGQMHFIRAVFDSIDEVIERHLAEHHSPPELSGAGVKGGAE